jgi:hypothetical protein
MTLQVRRGTNSERLGITPLQGELIYVTDTKQLFVGDGATAGGTTAVAGTIDSLLADTSPQLGGELDLNGNNITGTGNINITGNITASGNINLGDGAGGDTLVIGGAIQGHMVPDTTVTYNLGADNLYWKEAWISQLNVENQLTVGRIMGSLIADDSTVVFDSETGLVTADQLTGTLPAGVIPAAMTSNITGNLTGNADGAHTGTFDGDMTGSLFADDSTLVVDGINGSIHASSFIPNGNIIEVSSISAATSVKQQIISLDADSELSLIKKSASDLSASSATLGTISFGVEDSNGAKASAIILGNKDSLYLMADSAGTFADATLAVTLTDGKLAVGSFGPATEKLEVIGNIKASGTIMPGVYADTTARDAAHATPTNGQMIYLTATHKFQGYANGAWADLN